MPITQFGTDLKILGRTVWIGAENYIFPVEPAVSVLNPSEKVLAVDSPTIDEAAVIEHYIS